MSITVKILDLMNELERTHNNSRSRWVTLKALLEQQQAVEQPQFAPNTCPYCLGKGKESLNGVLVRCRFCSSCGGIKDG